MDITLRARNCEISNKLKQEARRKAEHATRFFDRVTDLEISFAEESNPRIPNPAKVEITARSKKHTVRALGAGEDHHEAMDQAVARFERQLRRYKTRLIDRGRRGREDRTTGEMPQLLAGTNGSRPNGINGKGSEEEPRIVRRKHFELTAMFPDEAVMQLELLGHDFYLYTNAGTGEPNVVYRRHDGEIGLIEGALASVPTVATG